MSRNKFLQKLFSFVTISLTAIAFTALTSKYHQSSAEPEQPHWEYRGEFNSYRWGDLSPEFESCKLGSNQSPINIDNVDSYLKGESAGIKFNYQSSVVDVVNNGHTIQVNYEPGSSVEINNEKYELIQFHFHTPSEHKIDHQTSAMEAHFVHKNDAGKIAVVAVMINTGVENPIISRIWETTSSRNKVGKAGSVILNANNLLPDNKNLFSYQGSLTTPPCSEGVSWSVLLEPIELSPEQVATFQQIFQHNARPLQPLNGRSVQFRRGNPSVQ